MDYGYDIASSFAATRRYIPQFPPFSIHKSTDDLLRHADRRARKPKTPCSGFCSKVPTYDKQVVCPHLILSWYTLLYSIFIDLYLGMRRFTTMYGRSWWWSHDKGMSIAVTSLLFTPESHVYGNDSRQSSHFWERPKGLHISRLWRLQRKSEQRCYLVLPLISHIRGGVRDARKAREEQMSSYLANKPCYFPCSLFHHARCLSDTERSTKKLIRAKSEPQVILHHLYMTYSILLIYILWSSRATDRL